MSSSLMQQLQAFAERFIASESTLIQKIRIQYLLEEDQSKLVWYIDNGDYTASNNNLGIATPCFIQVFNTVDRVFSIFLLHDAFLKPCLMSMQVQALQIPSREEQQQKYLFLKDRTIIFIAAMDMHLCSLATKLAVEDADFSSTYHFEVDEPCSVWAYMDTSIHNADKANRFAAHVAKLQQQQQQQQQNVTIRDMHNSEAHIVNDYWKYKNPLSLEMMQFAVQKRPSSCCAVKPVADNQDEELASFLVTRQDGAMSCLHTLEKYRGKGYASLASRDLALKIIDKYQKQEQQPSVKKNYKVPYCYIVKGNDASEICYQKMGFEKLDCEISWFIIAAKKQQQ